MFGTATIVFMGANETTPHIPTAQLLPRVRELNVDIIAFPAHYIAAKYCGLQKKEIDGIASPAMIQNRVFVAVPDSLCQVETGICELGAIIFYS